MTKKKVAPAKKILFQPAKFKVEETLLKSPPKSMPCNLAEEKEKFLRSGKAPRFEVKDRAKLDELALKTRNQIRFDLFGEASYIINKVYDTYGNGEFFLEHAFGPRISKEEATPMLLTYIEENCLTESMKIHWCDNMACSAKLVWTGPVVNANRPELRRYSLWINGSEENNYMRESGIRCLLDHEIGTHFFRSFNDGFQPWFSERERFGLRKLGAFEGQCTEEGLATINTVLRGRVKLLWTAALAYYTACKAAEMTFKQLFDHLGQYTSNREYRWKQAMRVKRGLADPNDLGGFGNDQCYFEGAVAILRNMENIDFYLLMTGKVCHDELDRIKRLARKDAIQFPMFMKNMMAYRKTLRKMILLNNLNGHHPQKNPPDAYVKRLAERKSGKKGQKLKKVRANNKLSLLAKKIAQNKKEPVPDECEIENVVEEVSNFKCSHPFVNLHLRPKNLGENILEDHKSIVDTVAKLSEDISSKDSSLVNHIQRLHGIVHEHTWSCEGDDYRDGLIKEAEEQLHISHSSCCCEDPGSESQTSLIEHHPCSAPMEYLGGGDTAKHCSHRKTDVPDSSISSRNGEDRDSQTSPSSSIVPFPDSNSNDNCKKEKSNANFEAGSSHNMCNSPLSAKENGKLHSSKNSSGLLQKRKLNCRQASRKLLHTPLVDLTAMDAMESGFEQRKSLELMAVRKRISLNAPGMRDNSTSLQEMASLPNSTLRSLQRRPDSFERQAKDVFRRNDQSPGKIQIDMLDLAASQGSPTRMLDLKRREQGSSLSFSSVSSEIDYENFLRVKHHVFQSNLNNRKIIMSHRSPISGVEFLGERPNSTLLPDCKDHLNHILFSEEPADAGKNTGDGNYFQPLIISSSKPLVHRAYDSSKNNYPFF